MANRRTRSTRVSPSLVAMRSTGAAITMGTAVAAGPSTIVDLYMETLGTYPAAFSMSACVGLLNRETPSVYSMMSTDDSDWLARMYNVSVPVDVRDETTGYTPLCEFVDMCLAAPVVQGYILYDYGRQQSLVPQIATMVGVLSALPIDTSSQQDLLATAQASGELHEEATGGACD